MSVIRRLKSLHMTTKDKLDLSVTLISLADCIWVLGEVTHNGFQWYHTFVIGLLAIGTFFSIRILVKLIIRHHKAYINKKINRRIKGCKIFDTTSKGK
jgi:hypothetical protein